MEDGGGTELLRPTVTPAWSPSETRRPLRLSLFHRLLQNGRFSLDGMAEVHGEALVPSLIVPNQILQTLKKCLLYALGHLEGQKEQEGADKDEKVKKHKRADNSEPKTQRDCNLSKTSLNSITTFMF